MSPRREILDSDDDASDFGDGPEYTHTDGPHESEEPAHGADGKDATHDASPGSTDPSFFQRVYDGQQTGADATEIVPESVPVGASVSAYTEVSSAPPPGQRPPPESFSSLTPITDPAPASRKPKRNREARQAEIVDLTDITTPTKEATGGAGGGSDVWDVPSSARSQRRATKTYGKRQRTGQQQQLSLQQEEAASDMPPTQDPYDFPDTTPRTRKRPRRGTPPSSAAQPGESSPVLLVPTDDAGSSGRRTTRSRGRDSAAPAETGSSSLYIAQSTLTASQKREYETVSLSSEAGVEVPETSLPRQPVGMGEMYKSSCATTIAYPTPSRVRSSRRGAELFDGVDEDGVAGASPGRGDPDHQVRCYDATWGGEDALTCSQPSSPDVLTDMSTVNSTRAKRSRARVVSSDGLASSEVDSPAGTRRAKKMRVIQDEDDSWEQDPLDDAQNNHDSPYQDAHDEREASGQPADLDVTEGPATAPEPAPKKRGRKKKGAKAKEPTPPAEANPTPAAAPPEATEAPVKRKRGRPRKSEASKPETTQPQPEPADETAQKSSDDNVNNSHDTNPPPSPQPLSERPGNSQQAAQSEHQPRPLTTNTNAMGSGDGGDAKENSAVAEPTARNDSSNMDSAKAKGEGKGDEGKGDVKKEEGQGKQGVAAAAKPTIPKVQYRVGLSRRSRIAPLLKSLKKPPV